MLDIKQYYYGFKKPIETFDFTDFEINSILDSLSYPRKFEEYEVNTKNLQGDKNLIFKFKEGSHLANDEKNIFHCYFEYFVILKHEDCFSMIFGFQKSFYHSNHTKYLRAVDFEELIFFIDNFIKYETI